MIFLTLVVKILFSFSFGSTEVIAVTGVSLINLDLFFFGILQVAEYSIDLPATFSKTQNISNVTFTTLEIHT